MTKAKRFTGGAVAAVWVSMGGASMKEASALRATGETPAGVGTWRQGVGLGGVRWLRHARCGSPPADGLGSGRARDRPAPGVPGRRDPERAVDPQGAADGREAAEADDTGPPRGRQVVAGQRHLRR